MTTYYVDCAAGSDSASGTGPATAWRTLAKASGAAYLPGDRVLFRRGTTCTGTFAPTASGAAGAPLAAGAYGGGAEPRLAGGGARAAILLDNVQYWELRDLDVTNTGPATTTERRAGILVRLHDAGTGRHYLVDGVSVHDVNGADFKDPDPSGGILVAVQGSAKPTRFDGVTIRNSSVAHTDRTGIGTSPTWGRRPAHPNGPGTSFAPITGLSVHHNTVRDAGGDGTVVQNADNEGGFLLICNGAGMISDRNSVRYNVSVNDRNTTAPYGVIPVVCAPATRTLVHHNTVTTNAPGTAVVSSNGPGGVTFRDNIFAGAAAGSPLADARNTYDHNLYARISPVPATDAGTVRGDPRFLAPYDVRLRAGSPALGAGVPVPGGGDRDFYGNPVPDPPNLGADQGRGK